MSSLEKQCYICYRNRTKNILKDVPVCEGCMERHFKATEKNVGTEEVPTLDLNLDLNWDGEDTQPMWASFLNESEE